MGVVKVFTERGRLALLRNKGERKNLKVTQRIGILSFFKVREVEDGIVFEARHKLASVISPLRLYEVLRDSFLNEDCVEQLDFEVKVSE